MISIEVYLFPNTNIQIKYYFVISLHLRMLLERQKQKTKKVDLYFIVTCMSQFTNASYCLSLKFPNPQGFVQ